MGDVEDWEYFKLLFFDKYFLDSVRYAEGSWLIMFGARGDVSGNLCLKV